MNGMGVINNHNGNRNGLQNTFYGPSCNPRMTAPPVSQGAQVNSNRSPEMNMANVFKLFFQILGASQGMQGQRPPHSIFAPTTPYGQTVASPRPASPLAIPTSARKDNTAVLIALLLNQNGGHPLIPNQTSPSPNVVTPTPPNNDHTELPWISTSMTPIEYSGPKSDPEDELQYIDFVPSTSEPTPAPTPTPTPTPAPAPTPAPTPAPAPAPAPTPTPAPAPARTLYSPEEMAAYVEKINPGYILSQVKQSEAAKIESIRSRK
jgi:hypothetical protein